MNIYKIYFHIYLNYYHLKTDTVAHLILGLVKFLSHMTSPLLPPAQMLHDLCRPVWSTCRCTRGYAQWVLGSFSPLQ